MAVIYCYFERENYKIFKFRVNDSSDFEMSASLF